MLIVFREKSSGNLIQHDDMYFIRADGSVWKGTGETCESQSACVGFEDFGVECPDVEWGLVE